MFLTRLSKSGIDTSKYYQTKKFNKALGTINDMPNCVCYDVCRTYEICQVDEPFIMFKNRSAGGYPDADSWYRDTILPKGKDLKEGSIACFDNHVAIIEKVNEDGTCLITDSRFDTNKSLRNERYWRKVDNVRLVVGNKPNLNGVGVFQGCIYLPFKDIRVQRDLTKEQIEILDPDVNVRTSPNGDVVIKGCYAPLGIYNVKSSKLVDDFLWFEIEKGYWIRTGEWLRYYPVDDELEKLKKENELLKKKLKEINKLSEV